MHNSIFDTFHITYIITSLVVTFLIIFLLNKYIRKQKHKDITLLLLGIVTFFLHISEMWIEFLKTGHASAADNILFTIYFCNLAMVLLLVTGLMKNKSSRIFKYFAVTTAYASIFGSTISLFYPDYYISSEVLNWHVIKSFLSHSVMLVGGIYLLTNKYFKIERANTKVYDIGLLAFGINGLIINAVFKFAKLPPPNSMYLQAPPIEELPYITWYTIAIVFLLIIYFTTALYERITNPVMISDSVTISA